MGRESEVYCRIRGIHTDHWEDGYVTYNIYPTDNSQHTIHCRCACLYCMKRVAGQSVHLDMIFSGTFRKQWYEHFCYILCNGEQ